jgi:hypothetical protein
LSSTLSGNWSEGSGNEIADEPHEELYRRPSFTITNGFGRVNAPRLLRRADGCQHGRPGNLIPGHLKSASRPSPAPSRRAPSDYPWSLGWNGLDSMRQSEPRQATCVCGQLPNNCAKLDPACALNPCRKVGPRRGRNIPVFIDNMLINQWITRVGAAGPAVFAVSSPSPLTMRDQGFFHNLFHTPRSRKNAGFQPLGDIFSGGRKVACRRSRSEVLTRARTRTRLSSNCVETTVP